MNLAELRRDLEDSLGKMRVMQDRQAENALVDKEADYLRGALESKQKMYDELLRNNSVVVKKNEDALSAMFAATQSLRELQQRALSGTVTAVLVEEVEALRVLAKDASSQRDTCQQQNDGLREEIAGVRARQIATNKMRGEHKALESTSSSWEERVSVLEMQNEKLAEDLSQTKAETTEAKKTTKELVEHRTAAAQREAEYKAHLAAQEALVRVAQQHDEETSNSLQALLTDMWRLKHDNKQLCARLSAAAHSDRDDEAAVCAVRGKGHGHGRNASINTKAIVGMHGGDGDMGRGRGGGDDGGEARERLAFVANASASAHSRGEKRVGRAGGGVEEEGGRYKRDVPSASARVGSLAHVYEHQQQQMSGGDVKRLQQEVAALQKSSSQTARKLSETEQLLGLQEQLHTLVAEENASTANDLRQALLRQVEAEEETHKMEELMMSVKHTLDEQAALKSAELTAAHQLAHKACSYLAQIAAVAHDGGEGDSGGKGEAGDKGDVQRSNSCGSVQWDKHWLYFSAESRASQTRAGFVSQSLTCLPLGSPWASQLGDKKAIETHPPGSYSDSPRATRLGDRDVASCASLSSPHGQLLSNQQGISLSSPWGWIAQEEAVGGDRMQSSQVNTFQFEGDAQANTSQLVGDDVTSITGVQGTPRGTPTQPAVTVRTEAFFGGGGRELCQSCGGGGTDVEKEKWEQEKRGKLKTFIDDILDALQPIEGLIAKIPQRLLVKALQTATQCLVTAIRESEVEKVASSAAQQGLLKSIHSTRLYYHEKALQA